MDNENLVEESARYVRLALPLMSEHGVPATPANYTVWYDYVSGKNKELKKIIDSMIERAEQFSEEVNEMLFKRFCGGSDENTLRELREDLQKILSAVFSEVVKMSGQAEKYESLVSNIVDKLSEDLPIQDIRNIVGEIIVETRKWEYLGKQCRKN